MNKLIIERRIGYMEQKQMNLAQELINQKIMELDLVQHRMTLKWGFKRLQQLAPPDLLAKWNSQVEKLNAAVLSEDVPLVADLVAGSCRGLMALERAAVAAGHLPFAPEYWTVVIENGSEKTHYSVHREVVSFSGVSGASEATIVSLDELVRVYDAVRRKVYRLDDNGGCSDVVDGGSGIKPLPAEFWSKGGDEAVF